MHNAAIVLSRAKEDEENVQKVVSSVAAAIEKCSTAKTTAHGTLMEAEEVLENANATLQQWEAELEKALAWLARAEARLAAAIEEYERASEALRSAQRDLSRAEARLRDCLNDSERGDCSGEAAAVNRAIAKVEAAQHWVRVAEQEVIAAQEEVEQAKARVACCERAVDLSTQAVNLAQEGESNANQAVNSAERSLEYAQAAERLVNVAQEKVAAEVESAESMMTETRAAQSLTDDAALHLRTADSAEESAQRYSTSVRKELEYRLQQLYELNRASLVASFEGLEASEAAYDAIWRGVAEGARYGTQMMQGKAGELLALLSGGKFLLDRLSSKLHMRGGRFPIYDVVGHYVGSVKVRGLKETELSVDTLWNYCRDFRTMMGQGPDPEKFDQAATFLLQAEKGHLISVPASMKKITTLKQMKAYLRRCAEMHIPANHVEAVRQSLRNDIKKRPEIYGFSERKVAVEDIESLVQRIKPLGATTDDIWSMVETWMRLNKSRRK
jgi:exonuclease VII small subunit